MLQKFFHQERWYAFQRASGPDDRGGGSLLGERADTHGYAHRGNADHKLRGALEVYNGSTLTLTGTDSVSTGDLYTDSKSTVTIPGTLTNNSGGFVYLESSGDVLNVNSLSNSGEVYITTGATLNITGGGSGVTDVVSGSSLYVLGTLNVVNGGTPSNGLADLTTVAGTLEWGNRQTLTDTPTGGTLTINSGGSLEVYSGSTLSVANVSNSGNLYTDAKGTVTISGALTNSGNVYLQSSGDVLNVATLTNSGTVYVDPGATLNLTGAASTNSKTITFNSGGILEISASKVTISGDGQALRLRVLAIHRRTYHGSQLI